MNGKEGMMAQYKISIIKRYFDQTADDYHATVTRLSDGVELIWFSTFRWWLKVKIRRGALDRAFKDYDKRQARMAEEEVIWR